MTFLLLVPDDQARIDPEALRRVAGRHTITWIRQDDPASGGAVCFSSLAAVTRLRTSNGLDILLIGRVRLDRRAELCCELGVVGRDATFQLPDAELCLLAYQRWGDEFVRHIHGDYAFAITDEHKRRVVCARDRFGIRTLVWSRNHAGFWVAGSLQNLVSASGFDCGELDAQWISDFLSDGFCSDPTLSAFRGVRRLAPAHLLTLDMKGLSTTRYWELRVRAPMTLGSAAAYEKEFHTRLDAAIRDRLPAGRLGISMSGGLDSSTLAAKAVEIGGSQLNVFARTWIVGGDADPEVQASVRVASYLGLNHTLLEAEDLRVDPCWIDRPTSTPEPSLGVVMPDAYLAEMQAMRSEAAYWFYGEGPDNALTFEWQMHLRWLLKQGKWLALPSVVASYFASKSPRDWMTTVRSLWGREVRGPNEKWSNPRWVRYPSSPSLKDAPDQWRPRAHQSFASALWPALFEGLDAEASEFDIEWRHPFMDLRVLEFLLATPPIPWARHKRLIRLAMRGRLPEETLKRPKVPLYKDDMEAMLRRHLPAMPRQGDAVEEFVDLAALPQDPVAYPDIYALTRVPILQHWLKTRHG